MDDDQQFCLRWNNHQSTLISVFDTLLENGTLVDCTLAAEGKFLKAHKVVLSACSPYFAALLSQQYDKHPIFILKDIKFQELRAMMDYMYRGEVNISQDQLAALLKAAESLQIKGLSESRGGSTQKNENVVQKQPVPVVSKSGLTIEHKRPANKHPTSAATESDVSMSREGSTSPTSRKRKKFRRRSIEVNNMDNHDQLSNSSSQSQSIHMTSIPMTAASQITSATSAANVLNVTKKTDHHDSKKDMEQSQADDDEDDDKNDLEPPAQRQKHDMDVSHIKEKMQSTHSELLIEPKNEYDDGQDETVEDLTLDDEELLEDLDQAGPSHGGEGSSQGYAQWQVGQNQDEVFLAAQEAAGQHRDAQDPLCGYTVLDNYKDLRDKFEIMIQENASLKFELHGLMERNLALQKAFSNTGKDVPIVNYVENEYGRYYDGNIFIKKQDCVQLDATEHPREYINHLLVILFGRDVLKRSCVTGQMSNRFRDKDRKPPLDPIKLQLIYKLVAAKTNNDKEYSNSVINRIIAKKIYNLLAADKRVK
ncbi:longitudinals lacking protein, isoforms H/M/V isoform X10 [Bradysia coprophila]|uniref:longitudinals lacking protein, isoforms H/M/V isoform X10 n=1 Tax=Bradysia coprophila TaxID=38358 RepID=UPI00187D72CC|nr:longitudinals lacking protein, isoforms H/M/V isoform X10 [Bradysia coprophila]